MHRRDFLKQSCIQCLNILALGAIPSLLASCASLPSISFATPQNFLEINKLLFVNEKTKQKSKLVLVKPQWMNYDILVVEQDENNYTALLMRCTHEDVALTPTENGIYCNAHGSSFSLGGKVTKQPALADLKSFKTQVTQDKIIIFLT